MRFETFTPLARFPFITHAFTVRDGDDTRSDAYQDQVLEALGLPPLRSAAAEQTHGQGAAIVSEPVSRVPGVDALATDTENLPLLIRCADCAAVYIVDRATPAIGLIHSGRTGTLGNVVGNTLATMTTRLGTRPQDCLAFISPSIGPCHYEMDIWSGIERQLHEQGVTEIHNPRICTACHLDRYFSYRAERGRTGRMLAVLSLSPSSTPTQRRAAWGHPAAASAMAEEARGLQSDSGFREFVEGRVP